MQLMDAILIIVGLGGLFIGGESLVKGASRVAQSFGVSPLIIGMTIVAVGTSAPELLVSVSAAIQGSSAIAMGNVVGSNIANIGLILGLTGLITPLTVNAILVRREIPILIVVTIFAYLLVLDGELSRLDGILLLFGFVSYNGLFYFLATQETNGEAAKAENTAEDKEATNLLLEMGRLTFGIILLVVGANALVTGATSVARDLGVSELVIGITMVALGTSLPELAASVAAALRKESDIAVGNIIGSNIANLLLILGATASITPIPIDQGLTQFEFLVMFGFTLLIFPFALNRRLSRRESAAFLGAYLAFILYTFIPTG